MGVSKEKIMSQPTDEQQKELQEQSVAEEQSTEQPTTEPQMSQDKPSTENQHPLPISQRSKWLMSLFTSLIAIAAVGIAAWLGVSIGRSSERAYFEDLMERQACNDGTTNIDMEEYARELAALEQYMAGEDKMLQTIAAVRNYYVDPVKIDTIYEKAIPALLAELDPHSEYLPASMFSSVNESLEGEFDGIGIVVVECEIHRLVHPLLRGCFLQCHFSFEYAIAFIGDGRTACAHIATDVHGDG